MLEQILRLFGLQEALGAEHTNRMLQHMTIDEASLFLEGKTVKTEEQNE
ncbi:hypothetical protein [Paenibacillus antarcticus]|nr:hypothetical protein [Paenibacillus antarcticus]